VAPAVNLKSGQSTGGQTQVPGSYLKSGPRSQPEEWPEYWGHWRTGLVPEEWPQYCGSKTRTGLVPEEWPEYWGHWRTGLVPEEWPQST
jgi:hypothetical protein